MNLFYCEDLEGADAILDPEESRHCIRVLRFGEGDRLHAVDGKGRLAECIIRDTRPGAVGLEIVSVKEECGKMPYHLHIAIAPTKSHQRFEWFLEKATEIGVSEITPLVCSRSERKKIRSDRARKVLIAAMKQANRTYLPLLRNETGFSEFLSSADGVDNFIASCFGRDRMSLHPGSFTSCRVGFLVGPEGDFTKEEFQQALDCDYRPVSLGTFVLRTETAGIVACSEIRRIFEVERR